jgi:hypothetical protein
MIYSFNLINQPDGGYLIKVLYFDSNFNFIKEELINSASSIISGTFSAGYVHNKGKTLTIGYGDAILSFPLKNGFFVDGDQSYSKRKVTTSNHYFLHAYDDKHGTVFIIRDENSIKAVKSYINLS